jgi:hypothetical protein
LWILAAFSVSWSIHSRQDSLDGGSARTQGRYLHTAQTLTDICASSGIRNYDPVFERSKTVHALDLSASEIGSVSVFHLRNYAEFLIAFDSLTLHQKFSGEFNFGSCRPSATPSRSAGWNSVV